MTIKIIGLIFTLIFSCGAIAMAIIYLSGNNYIHAGWLFIIYAIASVFACSLALGVLP